MFARLWKSELWSDLRRVATVGLIVIAFAAGFVLGYRVGLVSGYAEFQEFFVDPSLRGPS
jgi:ABC-type nitrate/sulfonate/bicarbonate transport system permease component